VTIGSNTETSRLTTRTIPVHQKPFSFRRVLASAPLPATPHHHSFLSHLPLPPAPPNHHHSFLSRPRFPPLPPASPPLPPVTPRSNPSFDPSGQPPRSTLPLDPVDSTLSFDPVNWAPEHCSTYERSQRAAAAASPPPIPLGTGTQTHFYSGESAR